MKFRLLALAAAVTALAACAGNEGSPVAPPGRTPPPSPDRYVDQATGKNSSSGSAAHPWATISHAVAAADTDITIHVAPGTYDAAHGETFPITLKKGHILLGDIAGKGAGTLIQGEAPYALGIINGTAILGADSARVAGFSIANQTNPTSYAGIAADGVTMEIDHNTFLNAMYAGVNANHGANLDAHDNLVQSRGYGLILDGSGVVRVHDNTIEMGLYGIRLFNANDIEIDNNVIRATTAGVLVGNGLSNRIHDNTFNNAGGYQSGAILYSGGSTLIRANTFLTGPGIYINTGGAVPDAGTAASPGQNDFSAIPGVALKHAGQGTVPAIGNTWANNPPQVGVDILITGGGAVLTQ